MKDQNLQACVSNVLLLWTGLSPSYHTTGSFPNWLSSVTSSFSSRVAWILARHIHTYIHTDRAPVIAFWLLWGVCSGGPSLAILVAEKKESLLSTHAHYKRQGQGTVLTWMFVWLWCLFQKRATVTIKKCRIITYSVVWNIFVIKEAVNSLLWEIHVIYFYAHSHVFTNLPWKGINCNSDYLSVMVHFVKKKITQQCFLNIVTLFLQVQHFSVNGSLLGTFKNNVCQIFVIVKLHMIIFMIKFV